MLLTLANKIPPFLCRILARKKSGWSALSHSDLAARTGLPRSSIADLSQKTSWSGVPIDVIDRFSRGCGVDLTRPEAYHRKLRRLSFKHIARANPNQRRFFHRLLRNKIAAD
jgi:hypothetical protein